jgi:hypothetical protein
MKTRLERAKLYELRAKTDRQLNTLLHRQLDAASLKSRRGVDIAEIRATVGAVERLLPFVDSESRPDLERRLGEVKNAGCRVRVAC